MSAKMWGGWSGRLVVMSGVKVRLEAGLRWGCWVGMLGGEVGFFLGVKKVPSNSVFMRVGSSWRSVGDVRGHILHIYGPLTIITLTLLFQFSGFG
jgi:hypothetical protein